MHRASWSHGLEGLEPIALARPGAVHVATRGAVESALERELVPSLPTLAGARLTLAVPDATRPLELDLVIEPLVERLGGLGADVTMLVALGLHRPMTEAELAPLAEIASRHGARLTQHAPSDPAALRSAGPDAAAFADGTGVMLPRLFHRAIVEADVVVCAGLVEPHQYAGYSGGVKTIGIGCASKRTISGMHGLQFLRDPGMRLGAVDGNPFQAALWRLVERPTFALEVVPAGPGECLGVFAGPTRDAYDRAVGLAAREMFVDVPEPFDWIHLPVPAAKAQSFYQASRAASYVALAAEPAIRRGGTLVLEAPCPEGFGQGEGERAGERAILRGRQALLDELAGEVEPPEPVSGGAQRAYVLARTLEQAKVVLVGAPEIPSLRALGVVQLPSMEAAVRELSLERGRGATVEDVFLRVPRTAPRSAAR